jgi:hypothetical protein
VESGQRHPSVHWNTSQGEVLLTLSGLVEGVFSGIQREVKFRPCNAKVDVGFVLSWVLVSIWIKVGVVGLGSGVRDV